MYFDAHCHISFLNLEEISKLLNHLTSDHGDLTMVIGGTEKRDWEFQVKVRQKYKSQIRCGFGLHPYWVANADGDEIEYQLDVLAKMISSADLLGEVGLDFREEYTNQGRDIQTEVFSRQLSLRGQLPVVVHSVRAHHEVLRQLKKHSVDNFMLHGFRGKYELAKSYLDLGGYLSFGRNLLIADDPAITWLHKLPVERLLVESDLPSVGGMYPQDLVKQISQRMGKALGRSESDMWHQLGENLQNFLQYE